MLTRIPDSWAWMRPDLLIRLAPFAAVYGAVELIWRPAWLGFSPGRIGVQLGFGVIGAPLIFAAAVVVQRSLTRQRGALGVPASAGDAWFQAGFYVVNGPIEEAFFRGLVQGGLGVILGMPAGFAIATVVTPLLRRACTESSKHGAIPRSRGF